MKRFISVCLLSLLLAVSAQAASIAVNFAENAANQVFAGGQEIGPTNLDSALWNSTIDMDSGTLAAGTKANLQEDSGDPTTADVSWSSANVWHNGDGTGSDQAKLAVGYLDDGGSGNGFTVTEIPYTIYNAYEPVA
ncbi:MAG: hypothetical protein JEZ07_19860 [Phycisphaerae bacterium]|nr:hypothetical protein [Phycisphaerae bacterium]